MACDDRAEADDIGFGVGKIRAARARQLRFEFVFVAHENFLHLLGGLVFVIFAQIAVAARDGDFLRVGRDFFLHQILILDAAAFETFPRDEQAVLLGLLAGDERLHGRMRFDEPREQRTLVHVVKNRRKLQRARQILDDFDVRGRGQFADQLLVFQNEIAQTVRAFFVELVAFHRGEHRAENFRAEDVHEIFIAFAAEPQKQFAAGRVLVDVPGERFLQQIQFAFADEQVGEFLGELRGNQIDRTAQNFVPAFGIRLLERFERAMMFGGGNGFEQRAEFDAVLQPDLRGGNFALRRLANRRHGAIRRAQKSPRARPPVACVDAKRCPRSAR